MEKYWDGLKDFEKAKPSTNHILNPKTREQLNMMYSSPLTLPIPPHLERPPSPVDAIERGCDFLTREYQKGFMPKFDAENYKKTLLRPALLAKAHHKMIQKNTQKFDLNKLYETEKYQEFWLTSNTVMKVKKEISKLPFISSSDIQVVIGRFLELTASIVRTMKNKNMLDNEDKQNKKQLRATMIHFIKETKVARRKAFRYAFQQELIDLDRLDDAYKEEFKDEIPKYSRQQNRNDQKSKNFNYLDSSIDEKMVEQYSIICEKLPDSYKMKSYQMTEDQQIKNNKEVKKFVNSLPQKILKGITQVELQKAQSEPVIDSNKINDELQKEEEKINENNTDDTIYIDQYENLDFEGFPILYPSSYKVNDFDILNSCNVQIKKPTPKIITIPREPKKIDMIEEPSENSKEEMMNPQKVHFDYWKSFDPLSNVRSGNKEFESINEIHKISSSFKAIYDHSHDFDTSLPFKLEYDEITSNEAKKIEEEKTSRKTNRKEKKKKRNLIPTETSKGPTLIGDIWTTSDLLNHTSYNSNTNDTISYFTDEEEEEEESFETPIRDNYFNNQDRFRQMTVESEKRNNDAMEFLKTFKLNKNTKKSSLIVSKLQEIWENLGFSVQQKISLLVKYTSSTEESQRLNEALNFWELTFEIVSRYNDSYQNLKDFIRFEAPTSHYAKSTCEMLKQQVESCEENVKQIAENLLATFGDELIIKKKTVQQIIPGRHKKMMDMISPYCGN